MFRMNGKNNRKKTSKEKKVEGKQKYQEDFNEIILNDLVPEEKRDDFGLDSVEEPKVKKSGKLKLNLGLNSKKSSLNSKGKKSNSSEPSKKTKQENKKTQDNINENSKNKNNKKNSSDVSKGKKTNKTNKKTKSTKPSQSNIEEIKEDITPKVEKNVKSNKKGNLGMKKKRVKHSSKESYNKESDSETKRSLEENEDKENYIVEDNFDAIQFRNTEELEEAPIEESVEEKSKSRFDNLVWSEDKFPKK